MKKFLAFALVALAVTAAQAVTCSWSTTDFTEQLSQAIDLSNGKSASVALTLSFTDVAASLSADATFASVTVTSASGELKKNGNGVHLHAYQQNGGIGGNIGNGGAGEWLPSNTAVGKESHTIVVTMANNGSSSSTVKIYIDGTLAVKGSVSSWETSNTDRWNGYTYGKPLYFNTATTSYDTHWDYESAAIYSGVLSADEIKWLVENDTAVLPEPTALALLALGVAGLALKRKVA